MVKNELLDKKFEKDLYLLIQKVFISALEEETPVTSGEMKRAWNVFKEKDLVYVITNDTEYAEYVERGTGIFGPHKKRIYPKNARVLTFKIGGIRVFAHSIKGQMPQLILHKIAHSKKIEDEFRVGLEKLVEERFYRLVSKDKITL